MLILYTYAGYLVASLALTVWVAHTLFKNGRAFLVDAFHGNEALADSINHLLVVGFYLVNLGYVTLYLRAGIYPNSVPQCIELLSSKLGHVAVVLGAMHFFNLYVFTVMRKNARLQDAPPPVLPTGVKVGAAR